MPTLVVTFEPDEAGRRRTEEALPALEDLLEKQEGSAVSRWMSAVKERLVGDRA